MLEYWTVEWTDGKIACYLDLDDAPSGLFRRVLWRRLPAKLVWLVGQNNSIVKIDLHTAKDFA